jgi:hypothetical protein
MSTNLKASIRATMMGAIPTSVGSSGHLFIYSGSSIPSKTASPTGTSAITAGIALSSTMGTTGGTESAVLTLSGTPLSGTATASITPFYYRVTDGATDDGSHTQIQGSCGVGSGDLNFSSTISSGGTVSISSLTWTEGDL